MDSIRVSEALDSSSILDGTTTVGAGASYPPMLDTEIKQNGDSVPRSCQAAGSCKLRGINLFLMIVPGTKSDFTQIYEIINDAASAYKGIIPEDRWHEPYMSETELQGQIDDGVTFWCYVENDIIIGVMGFQDKGDVTLIRHAYVRTTARNKGIGGKLLRYLIKLTTNPILIGTWADATWAIAFYKKYGFRLVSFEEKEKLLRKYWSIPLRQIETSVVLSSEV